MSEDEFLVRWSRRKREAKAQAAVPKNAELGDPTSAPPSSAIREDEPELDLSSLPPIDAITAATDITAFLRKGIPQELTRAALRRAWTADPAIRDFVGLAENAWDFNDPQAMPGFGPLDCSETELAAWVDRIVGGVRKIAEKASESLSDASVEPSDGSAKSAAELCEPEISTAADVVDQSAALASPPVVLQPATEERVERDINPVSVRRRAHGGALPH